MCGENKDCGCTAEQQAKHEAKEAFEAKMARAREYFAATPNALVAAAGPRDEETGLPTQWRAVLTVEGLRTTDHRRIANDALSWRQLPLAIFAQFNNAGHADAPIVGSIQAITKEPWISGMVLVKATGVFNLSIEAGRQAAQMCDDQTLRWGSIDLEVLDDRLVEVGSGSGGDMLDILFGEEDEGESDWYFEVLDGRIMGYTMVATPAFPQAVCCPMDRELEVPEPMGTAMEVSAGLMASGIPNIPPAAWHADPKLTEVTPLTIDDSGKVFGHLALWDTCHIGFDGLCITPPQSQAGYAYFMTGQIKLDNGEFAKVGHITYDTGHAGATLGWQDTTAHYDHTGSVGADITVGEDEFGIWVAGSLRANVTEEGMRALRSAPLSGDWRKIGTGLELVAALSVNVPGFPIVASAGRRNDEQVSLITAGVKPKNPMEQIAREIAQIRKAIQPLMPLATAQLATRVNLVNEGGDGPEAESILINFNKVQELRERVNA